MRKIIYLNIFKNVLRFFFSLVYDRKYVKGYYFDVKRMGFYWCFRSLANRLIGDNRKISWPVHPRTIVSNGKNVIFSVDDLHVFQTPGCYWQAHDAKIYVGRGCYVAPNVGIITTNHDVFDVSKHVKGKDIILGDKCWIGMNSVVLPGVELGENTIVAAGAVVSHSFPEGHCVIGGVPAKKIKDLHDEVRESSEK